MQSDVDTLFLAVNANKHGTKLNPERSVCRFEFMEAIVRMAILRYMTRMLTQPPPRFVSACYCFPPHITLALWWHC